MQEVKNMQEALHPFVSYLYFVLQDTCCIKQTCRTWKNSMTDFRIDVPKYGSEK